MSGARGGRGRGGGGRGGFGARGGFGGGGGVLPMGLTYADIQSISKEATALYPPLDPLPVLTEYSKDEKQICQLQLGFASRLRKSQYYVVEPHRSTELPRYSDKYRPSPASQPTLKKKQLHQPFFPAQIFNAYFNPKKKRKGDGQTIKVKHRVNIDEMDEDAEDQEKSSDDHSDLGSQGDASDYDVDEEYDNDYADNYFDNGENDDMDDLGGGGGMDEGAGGGTYD